MSLKEQTTMSDGGAGPRVESRHLSTGLWNVICKPGLFVLKSYFSSYWFLSCTEFPQQCISMFIYNERCHNIRHTYICYS